jgi:TonB family protein
MYWCRSSNSQNVAKNLGGIMLARLIESRYRFMRNDIGTAASVAVHLVLITVAAYITTAKAATTKQDKEPTHPLVYIRTLPPRPSPVAARRPTMSTPPANATHAIAPVSFAVDPNIPPIDVELAVVRHDDFGDGARGVFTDAPPGATTSGTSEAYDEREVDTPASSFNARVPVYPPSLRAAGIEGRVVAQFIVDPSGRATAESFRILSSSSDLFSEAVRKSILETRFTPARLRGQPVSQMVQQLFVFRLDR